MTHTAIINCSGREIKVTRIGKLLIIHSHRTSTIGERISTCRYDHRFTLLPREHQ